MERQEQIKLIERGFEDEAQQVSSKHEAFEQKLTSVSGYLFAFAVAFCLAASLGSAQALGGYVPEFQLNMWRYAAQVVLCTPGLVYNKVSLRVDRGDIPGMLLLTLCTNVINLCYYQSSLYLPVGTVVCLEGALLLLTLSTTSAVLGRQCLSPHLFVAIVIVLAGVVCVTQPDFLFNTGGYVLHPVCGRDTSGDHSDWNISLTEVASNQTDIARKASHTNANLGYLLIVISALGMATLTMTMNRKMRDVNAFVIMAWTGAGGVTVNLIAASIFEKLMFPSHAVCHLLLGSHAISVSLALLCTACSLYRIRPELFALIYNFQLVFVVVSQYTVLKKVNPGHHNLLEILGALIVFLGNCIDPSYKLYKNLQDGNVM